MIKKNNLKNTIRWCLGAYLPSISDESGSRRASAKVRFLLVLHNFNRVEEAKPLPFPESESAHTRYRCVPNTGASMKTGFITRSILEADANLKGRAIDEPVLGVE